MRSLGYPVEKGKEIFIKNIAPESDERVTDGLLRQYPQFIVLLAGQYFYDKVCGKNHAINTDIKVPASLGERAVSVAKRIFCKVFAEENAQGGFWILTVSGITEYGSGLMSRLPAEESVAGIIKRLYIDPALPLPDMECGFYEVSGGDENPGEYGPFYDCCTSRYLDVSALTAKECAESPLIGHIAAVSGGAYLRVEEYDNNRIFKILYWKK